MPYLGYLLAQALKAGETIAQAITSAANFVTKVGGSVVDLSPSVEALKSPSKGSASFNADGDIISFEVPKFTIKASAGWYYLKDDVTGNGTGREAWCFGTQQPNGLKFGDATGARSDEVITVYAYQGLTRSMVTSNYLDGSKLNGGQWYHIAFTNYGRSDEYYEVYVNGQAKAMNFVNSSGVNLMDTYNTDGSQNYIHLGGQYYNGYVNTLAGSLANVSFYDRSLSPEEIRSIMMKSYDELTATETKGLMMWFEYDGSATILSDKTDNATNGTVS